MALVDNVTALEINLAALKVAVAAASNQLGQLHNQIVDLQNQLASANVDPSLLTRIDAVSTDLKAQSDALTAAGAAAQG